MTLSEYFEQNRPKPKYEFGTRVFGYYKFNKKNIPFIGTTGADNMRSEEEGMKVTILLDLPMMLDKPTKVIRVSYNEIKSVLKNYETNQTIGSRLGERIPNRKASSQRTV